MRRLIFLTVASSVAISQTTNLYDALAELLASSECIQGSSTSPKPVFSVEELNGGNICYFQDGLFEAGSPDFAYYDVDGQLWGRQTELPEDQVPSVEECENKLICEGEFCLEQEQELTNEYADMEPDSEWRKVFENMEEEQLQGVCFATTPPERHAQAATIDYSRLLVIVPSKTEIEEGGASETTEEPSVIVSRSREGWRNYFASMGLEGALHVQSFNADFEISTDRIVAQYEAMLCGYTRVNGLPKGVGWWTQNTVYDGVPRRVVLVTDFHRNSEGAGSIPSWNALRKTVDSMLGPNVEGRLVQYGTQESPCKFETMRANANWNAVYRSHMLEEPYRPNKHDYSNSVGEIPKAPEDDCEEPEEGVDLGYTMVQCLYDLFVEEPKFDGEIIVLMAVGEAAAGAANDELNNLLDQKANSLKVVPMVVNPDGTENRCAMEDLATSLGAEDENPWLEYGGDDGWFNNGPSDLDKGPSFGTDDVDSTTEEPPIHTQTRIVVREVWSLGKYIGYLSLILICSALVVILIILIVRWFILRRQFSRIGQPY